MIVSKLNLQKLINSSKIKFVSLKLRSLQVQILNDYSRLKSLLRVLCCISVTPPKFQNDEHYIYIYIYIHVLLFSTFTKRKIIFSQTLYEIRMDTPEKQNLKILSRIFSIRIDKTRIVIVYFFFSFPNNDSAPY